MEFKVEPEYTFEPDEIMEINPNEPHRITQAELNDLIRDLDLPKNKSELLGSRLNEWNLLEEGVTTTVYPHRHEEIAQYFTMDGDLCYCNDVTSLLEDLCKDHKYDKNE